MDKILNLNDSIYDLSKQFPELIDILDGIGFHDIKKPGMLSTAGRFMTIKKGAAMKHIDLDMIKRTFSEHGFTIQE